jgi:hypothetical protein
MATIRELASFSPRGVPVRYLIAALLTLAACSPDRGALAACQERALDRLVSPATAVFSAPSVTGGPRSFEVRVSVDSENRAGAMLRSDVRCVVDDQGGGRWRVRESSIETR